MRSKWERTENPKIWRDQHGNVRNMTSEDPSDFKNEDGYKISNITQLTSFLPKNIANVSYNEPNRHHGNNPDFLYLQNEKMLVFLNEKIGNLCEKGVLQRQSNNLKKYQGAKLLFGNNGENLLFSELQKLFCVKTCLFDPIGYFKVCGNHLLLEDIASIDHLENIPGFSKELSLYDEFSQKPFPNINLDLLKNNSDGNMEDKASDINKSRIGQYEVWKFLVVIVSLYTCMEDKILKKIGSFTTSEWSEGKLYFLRSHIGKQSGVAKPPLSEWGWGPEYRPVDNPCTENPPCRACQKDYRRNESIQPIRHWMNIHYSKEECPGFNEHPGNSKDHADVQNHRVPEYVDNKMVYYCNIGGCAEECECSDCRIEATEEDNNQCKTHIPDHPENFQEDNHIQYHRKIFTEEEVQKEFLIVRLPNMEKDCEICQDNVYDHRFNHRTYHKFCNICNFMKTASEKSFRNICRVCLRIFSDKYKLKNHMGIHEPSFICEMCDKQFSCGQTLKKHTEEFHKEEGEAVYKCDICNMEYSNKRNLTDHIKTHTQPKEVLKCRLCSSEKFFRYARTLRRHYLSVHKIIPEYFLKIHSKQIPQHICDICGNVFGRKDILDKHKAKCPGFSCSLCKFSSKIKSNFEEHQKMQHMKCDYCDFQTIYKRNFIRHINGHNK